jgi:hypothetical protein
MHQLLWGYKVEEKLYVGVREQKKWLNTSGLDQRSPTIRTSRTTKLTILNPADH